MTASAVLLLIADGRWPTGGHAHSGGLEAAVATGLVTDASTLEAWLRGRLRTSGEVDASFVAAAWDLAGGGAEHEWSNLADEYWARVPVPSLRQASAALGRAVRRAADATWPNQVPSIASGVPWPLAFAAAGRAAGADRASVTLAAATGSVQGPAWSATRLMGIDPYLVAGCLARLTEDIEDVSRRACECDAAHRPAWSAPLIDIGAGQHANWEVRLFAS